ncbi:MAG: response regulator [bacterium]|nr:response regulator [bacterium]
MGLQENGTRLSSYYGGSALVAELPPVKGSSTSALTVLVTDDEAIVRTVLTSMLERLGCTVILTCSAPEAIRAYESHYTSIDLVLFDLMLPGMTGDRLYEQLRMINPACRAVLITGNSESELLPDLIASGVSGVLPKPFDVHELQAELSRVFAQDWQAHAA